MLYIFGATMIPRWKCSVVTFVVIILVESSSSRLQLLRREEPISVNRPTINRPTVNRPIINRPTINKPLFNSSTIRRPTVQNPNSIRPSFNRSATPSPVFNVYQTNRPIIIRYSRYSTDRPTSTEPTTSIPREPTSSTPPEPTVTRPTSVILHGEEDSTRPVEKETTPELIRSQNYPVEVHSVETEDGYILELHRIPYGKRQVPQRRSSRGRPVVFLQHCLLCSSSDWVINTPDKALGFILADQGYDVWLGNARGNTYSKRHKTLSSADKEFWNFSWDEIAYYDMPASIDHILQATNSSHLSYVGFSMGTIVFFAMMSERPEYNHKVNLMVAMGPVAFLENMGGPLSLLTRYAGPIKTFTDFVGIYEVLSGGILLDLLTSILCDPVVATLAPICDNLLLRIIGLDTELMMNKKLLPKILAHTPAGTSVRNMVHFMQSKNSGRFQMYSYGPSKNQKVYHSKFPPSYDLQKTRVPVALFWSENDWFANTKDVGRLVKLLPNPILNKKVSEESFSHVDFLWSDQAVNLIYGDILHLLHHYN